MPALTLAERGRRWRRLALLLLVVSAVAPLGLVALCGPTEWVMRTWARLAAAAVGLRVRRLGPLPPAGSLMVSNHVGYLDILALAGTVPGRFLAKREIAGWPLFGWLARLGKSVFIDRDNARGSRALLAPVVAALGRGDRVLVFPEGEVSPDGRSLRDFRPMLFQTCITAQRPAVPVALCYREPDDPVVWAWLDPPELWRHLWLRVLPRHQVTVEVRIGAPLFPAPDEDRKSLAGRVRGAVERLLAGAGPTVEP